MKRFKRYFLGIVNHFQSMETLAKKAGVKMGGGEILLFHVFGSLQNPILLK